MTQEAELSKAHVSRSSRKGVKGLGSLLPELLPTATERLSDLGSPLESGLSHTAWYTLAPPGQELIPPLPSQSFIFKIFSF